MVIAGYVLQRLRASPARWLPGALGVAIALAGFVVALVAPAIAGDVALRSELLALPPADRLVSVVALQRAAENGDAVDNFATQQLRDRGFDRVLQQTSLRQLATPSGTVFRLVGVDGIADVVTVTTGRLPQRCDGDVCEAVIWQRDSAPTDLALDPLLHISIVGTVSRSDDRLLNGTFAAEDNEVVVIVDGADSPAKIEALDLIQRSNGWIGEIDPAELTVAEVPQLLRDLASLASNNGVADLTVTGPDQELRAIVARAHITTARLALPAGQAGTMLGGFAMLTTLATRPWHRRGRRVLSLRAVTKRQDWLFTCVESGVIVAAGALLGGALGVAGVAMIASAANTNQREAIGRTLEMRPLFAVGALMLLYWLATVALLRSDPDTKRSRKRILPTDVFGLGAVAMWMLAAARGKTSTASLSSGTDPLLAAAPALATIAAACVVVRVAPHAVALAHRLMPKRAWPIRLALGASFRQGRALATIAFVTSAITLTTFALGYRSTLQVGAFDQAAFAVPFDFTLAQGPALVRPQQVLDSVSLPAQGLVATPVVRRGLALRRSGTAVETVEVIGLDPTTIDQMRGWRSDFGHRPDGSALLVPAASKTGTAFPAGTKSLVLSVSTPPPNFALALILERQDGSWHEQEALFSEPVNGWVADVEPTDVRLHGLRLGETSLSTGQVLHNAGEGTGTDGASLAIDIGIAAVRADGTELKIDWSQLIGQGIDVAATPDGANLSLVVKASSTIALFGDAPLPIPAVVDPVTASTAKGGIVSLETSGRGAVTLRVVGTSNMFPTIGGRFAVMDREALATQLNRAQPGSANANEVWFAANDPQAQQRLTEVFESAPFRVLNIEQRQRVERELAGNTLGQAVTAAFLWSSLIAAFLGAIAMMFLAHADRLDSIAAFRALSSDGASARQLAAIIVARSAALLAIAVPVGIAFGIVLLRAVRQLVSVSANGTTPVPALRTVVAASQIALCIAAMAVLALCGSSAIALRVRSIKPQDALAAQV